MPGQPGHQDRVQPGHVDAELQRGGGGQAGDLAGPQRFFQRPPLLRQVAGPVGGDSLGQVSRACLGQLAPGRLRHRLGAAPGPDERQRRHVAADQVGQQLGGLGGGGPPDRGAGLAARTGERRLPQREGQRGARRAVGADRLRRCRPVSRSPQRAGSLMVAEARTNTGSLALWW